jgi:arginine deiminase
MAATPHLTRTASLPHPLPPAPSVQSEVGPLRCVLLHRPGDELRAVRSGDPGAMLFDRDIAVEEARAEHDAFAAELRSRGVEVLYLRELLIEAIAARESVEALVDCALPQISQRVRARLLELGAQRLADVLIAGTTTQELLLPSRGGGRRVLEALPNLMFMRDQSVWIGDGVALARMATAARSREARLVAGVYRAHPRFRSAPVWTDAIASPAAFEGGDVIAAGAGRVLIGISERTAGTGARRLAAGLLSTGAAAEVVTVRIPSAAGFHLDLVLTIVDHDAVAVWEPARAALRAHRWRLGAAGVSASALPSLQDAFAPGTRMIDIPGGGVAPHGRPWDHGLNVLALAPGEVVAYADNVAANERLAAAGIEVVPVDGAALGQGRGGPRCLSCPVRRDMS